MRLAADESNCGCSCLAFLLWIVLAALVLPFLAKLAAGMIVLAALVAGVAAAAYITRALSSYLGRRK